MVRLCACGRIQDPDAAKPDDWDEDAPMLIDDPDASKPEGWMDDEPEEIPDPGEALDNCFLAQRRQRSREQACQDSTREDFVSFPRSRFRNAWKYLEYDTCTAWVLMPTLQRKGTVSRSVAACQVFYECVVGMGQVGTGELHRETKPLVLETPLGCCAVPQMRPRRRTGTRRRTASGSRPPSRTSSARWAAGPGSRRR